MLDRLGETITAVASAAGSGRLGIVRMSGPRSIEIASRMATTSYAGVIREAPGSTRVDCRIAVDECGELPAACFVFRAPHSYTREHSVEFHTIGSPAVLEFVRQRAIALGAVPAQPGEFTARAFVNGAMDLSSAEAVAEVIQARSDTQLAAARRMMDGGLGKRIAALRDDLAQLLALVEADIDFAEEPIEFITPSDARDRLASVRERLCELLRGSAVSERFEVLPRVLLLGRPNAGKSTLMNALSGTSRAITAAAAGTTRDILSAPMRLGQGEAVLLDAAGVDESDDTVIAQARVMVWLEAASADVVCVVVDLTNLEWDRVRDLIAHLSVPRVVIAANKIDAVEDFPERASALHNLASAGPFDRGGPEVPVLCISARTGEGLSELQAAFVSALAEHATTTLGESMLITERQRAAIEGAGASIARAVDLGGFARETIDCAELLAFELREALETLGTVTGDVTTEDLLGQVFARFCIGK